MTTYTVQPKNPDADPHDYQAESLEDVAGKTGVSVDELHHANAGIIGSSADAELTVGTELVIPDASSDAGAESSSSSSTEPEDPDNGYA